MGDFGGAAEGFGFGDCWRRSGDFQRQSGVVRASRRDAPRSVPELARKRRRGKFIGGLRGGRGRRRREKIYKRHRERRTEGTGRMVATGQSESPSGGREDFPPPDSRR